MRPIVFMLAMLLSITAIGQKIMDTTAWYNGELTKKRIEFNSSGQVIKETYYFPNNQILAEYSFVDQKNTQWIVYDKAGNQTAEWIDPEQGNAKNKKIRAISFSITLLAALAIVILGIRFNYQKSYYALLILSVIYPFAILLIEDRLFTRNSSPSLDYTLTSLLFILPGFLLFLSLINFFKKTSIPKAISILAILISISFLLFFSMLSKIAGAGIVG
jgi:hypothetical protein